MRSQRPFPFTVLHISLCVHDTMHVASLTSMGDPKINGKSTEKRDRVPILTSTIGYYGERRAACSKTTNQHQSASHCVRVPSGSAQSFS